MNEYTIFWTPAQQSAFLTACPFINASAATYLEGDYFALVQPLNPHQFGLVQTECQAERILGIKPGNNPGGSPTGCA